jgi:cardiolipin synthase
VQKSKKPLNRRIPGLRRIRRWKPILRPLPGRRLARDLRGPGAERLAAALPRGLRDPGFEILLRRIDEGPILEANRVEIYTDGEGAFAAMRAAIQSARQEILLESYILRDDPTGYDFLDDLGGAAARGVRVRVLADAFGSSETRRSFWSKMRERGIEAHLFHPLFPHLWSQPFRDHRKILVVDRSVSFLGGMNIGEEYGSTRKRSSLPKFRSWRDTHARIEGPVAWELTIVFAEAWGRSGGAPFSIEPLEPPSGPGARALVLDWRPRRGAEQAAAVLRAIAGGVRKRLWITNAYFAPKWRVIRALGAAAGRGVDVRLLLPGRSDVPIVRHASHGFYRPLLSRGVRIFEYQPAMLHAKSFVADGYVSVVGSTNLDFRSFHFNGESNVVLLDEGVGERMEEIFRRDLSESREILLPAWRERSPAHRIGDRAARLLSPLL